MKSKSILKLSLVAAALAPVFAHAFDGTITFAGQLTATTCTVTAATKDQTVTLPTLPATSMTVAKPSSGTTPFTLAVSGCSAGTTFKPFFEGGPNVDATTGMVKNTGTATNVQLRLTNADGTWINISGASQGVNTGTLSSGAGTNDYAVSYYSVGGNATTGTVAGTVNYSMIYN